MGRCLDEEAQNGKQKHGGVRMELLKVMITVKCSIGSNIRKTKGDME